MAYSKIQQSISRLFIIKNILDRHLNNELPKLSDMEMQNTLNAIERIHGHILDLEERLKRLV